MIKPILEVTQLVILNIIYNIYYKKTIELNCFNSKNFMKLFLINY